MATETKITIVHTETIPQKYMEKEEARIHFGYGNKHPRTFNRLIAEFKEHEDYKEDGYRNPTGAVALLNIELFDSFIKWKDANKYTKRKVAVK